MRVPDAENTNVFVGISTLDLKEPMVSVVSCCARAL